MLNPQLLRVTRENPYNCTKWHFGFLKNRTYIFDSPDGIGCPFDEAAVPKDAISLL